MVQAEGCHFRYQDGTKYLPFGTTIYALVHQKEEVIEETFRSLAKAPFNKVRHCIFPKSYDFSRPTITHCCVQTNAMHKAAEWMEKYKKPVVFDECCYEGNIEHEWGSISAFEMVNRFWKACTAGAFATHGETYYSEDDIFLKYYGSYCPKYAAFRLPKDHSYKIEVIDVWEMTRTTLVEEGSGKVPLILPGKEGIAVLATRIDS